MEKKSLEFYRCPCKMCKSNNGEIFFSDFLKIILQNLTIDIQQLITFYMKVTKRR